MGNVKMPDRVKKRKKKKVEAYNMYTFQCAFNQLVYTKSKAHWTVYEDEECGGCYEAPIKLYPKVSGTF